MWKKLGEYEEKNAEDGKIKAEGVAYESEIISEFLTRYLEMALLMKSLHQNMI